MMMTPIDPALAVAVALHESMTAPDKEDWTILPLEEQRVLVAAYRETPAELFVFIERR